MSRKIKKVMVFGTFDILHPGHLNFFRQAKKLGDYLCIVVARDKTVKEIKGRLPRFNERKRLAKIKKLKIADRVRLGYEEDRCHVILEEKPDIICLGYDQDISKTNLSKQLGRCGLKVKIHRAKAYKPEIYKSSKLNKAQKISI